ncbi:hypothetical protein IPM62_04305 [Candidatus Woesebacteria bacterium]|nr:MAG: hypothetical protein IPM62_04305 [Candidatus Woesebacteria bacterium]
MKKLIPFVILLVGLVFIVAIYFLVIRKPAETETVNDEDTSALIEVALEDRPVAVLMPRSDGHWLDMEISKLGKFNAASMDYELLYKTGEGITQGVPGNIKLNGQDSIERELLLGSESSGKFRYDEGVESGTFSLKFRNDKGKLVAKFSTDFRFYSDTRDLTNANNTFVFSPDDDSKDYSLVMDTFGLPDGYSGNVSMGPFGVFSSGEITGTTNLSGTVQVWFDDAWQTVSDTSTSGIFITSN